MRTLLLCLMVSSSVALAQNGTWGGYVSGWVNDAPRSGSFTDLDYAARRVTLTQRQREYLVLQQLSAQQAFFAQQSYVQLQQVSARQEELSRVQLAQQQELASQQRRQALEQELAAQEQLLTQQQQLAVQQQLLAQQQQQAAAEELIRLAQREATLKRMEAEQKVQLQREEAARVALARAETDAKPRQKGPDIHRWVDEDGVVHYSTRPKR